MPVVQKARRDVGTAALPGARRQAAETSTSTGADLSRQKARTSEVLGAVGRQVTQFGGDAYARIKLEERQKADEVARLGWQTKLDAFETGLYDPQSGVMNLEGEASFGLPEKVDEDFAKLAGGIEQGLSTDEQRLQFRQDAANRGSNIALNVRRKVSGEMKKFDLSQTEAQVAAAGNLAKLNALDPRRVGVEIDRGVEVIVGYGKRNGLPKEAVDVQVLKFQSDAHVGVIDNLLSNGNERAAAVYFEEAKEAGQIAGDRIDEVEKAIDAGTLRKQAQTSSDEILRAGGTLTEQREKARAIDDPKLRDEVMQRIEHEATVNERAERDAHESLLRGVYDRLDRVNSIDAIPPGDWARMEPSERAGARSYVRARAEGVPIKTDSPTYYRLMQQAGDDPDGFAKVNLLSSRSRLDDGDFNQLANLQRSIKAGKLTQANADLAGFRTKNDIVNDTLTQYGIDPSAKYDTAEGRAIAQLRRMLDLRVEAAQDAGGKVTNVEVQQTLDEILSQSVTVPGSWWNFWPGGKSMSDTSKRVIDLDPEDVPASERQTIENALRKAGRPVTPTTVLDLYIRGLQRKAR